MRTVLGFARLAARSLLRRKLRAFFTTAGVAIAVSVLMSLVGFGVGYQNALDREMRSLGYEVLVTAKGCPYEAATMVLKGGSIPMYMDEEIAAAIAADPEVSLLTRLFMQASPPDAGQPLTLHLGIEQSYFELKPWIRFRAGGYFSGEAVDEVILGYNAADFLKKTVGDSITLGRSERRSFETAGVLDYSGTQDDGTIFLPLKAAQFLFDKKHKITGVGVKLKTLERMGEFMERANRFPSVQVVAMAQVRHALLGLIGTARFFVILVMCVAILVAVLGVMNTILLSVLERTPALGVMKALGASGLDLLWIVLLEAVLVSLAGALTSILPPPRSSSSS